MRDGAIAFVCMDWRHMGELLDAGEAVFTELKNLVVWKRREKLGLIEPASISDPDDIVIDMRTAEVRTDGPLDEDEKKKWNERLQRRDEAQAEVTEYARLRKLARKPKQRAFWLEQLHLEQRIFDIISDRMPERYKAKLEHRSFHADASREGKTLDEYRKKFAKRRQA